MKKEYERGEGNLNKKDLTSLKKKLIEGINERYNKLFEKAVDLYNNFNLKTKEDLKYVQYKLDEEFEYYSEYEIEYIINQMFDGEKFFKPKKKNKSNYNIRTKVFQEGLASVVFEDKNIIYNSGEDVLQIGKARHSILGKIFFSFIKEITYSQRTGFYFIQNTQGKEEICDVFGKYAKKDSPASKRLEKEFN